MDRKFQIKHNEPKGKELEQKVLDLLTGRAPDRRDSETDDEVADIKREKLVMKRRIREK